MVERFAAKGVNVGVQDLHRTIRRHDRNPLVDFSPDQIVIQMDGQGVPADTLFSRHSRRLRLPGGWQTDSEVAHQRMNSLGERAESA
jgi:hypothetical protein